MKTRLGAAALAIGFGLGLGLALHAPPSAEAAGVAVIARPAVVEKGAALVDQVHYRRRHVHRWRHWDTYSRPYFYYGFTPGYYGYYGYYGPRHYYRDRAYYQRPYYRGYAIYPRYYRW